MIKVLFYKIVSYVLLFIFSGSSKRSEKRVERNHRMQNLGAVLLTKALITN